MTSGLVLSMVATRTITSARTSSDSPGRMLAARSGSRLARLSSVESVSISVSSKPLKIFAETSAPIVARKIAALRAPVKLLSSSAIAHSMACGLRFLLHEPGADQLRGRFGLRRGKAERLLADVVPLAAQLEQLFRYERLRDPRHVFRRGRRGR